MAWALTESMLTRLFHQGARTGPVIADAIWSAVVSFDGKMSILHNVLVLRLEGKPLVDDWQLLHVYTRKLSKRRNEVAHATLLNVENRTAMLEPFFVLTKEKPRLSVADVEKRRNDFSELSNSLWWLLNQIIGQPALPTTSLPPIPDLLLRLRSEELHRREEQRKRHQSSQE